MEASGEQMALGQMGQEATCPLCLDFFQQPMGLSCGHNFCRDCLAQLGTEFSCPQCRAKVERGSAFPNRALANMVDLVKRLRLSEGAHQESNGQLLCQEHGQPLQTFCSSEKSLLCPGCLGSHHGHPLLSVPEAAQEYKDLLHGHLESLRKEGQKLLEQRQAEEQRWQECQEQFATEKQKVSLAVESLQELLRERQPVWLAWLTEQEEKMEAEWGVALAQVSGEASRLQQLMAQVERKCRQPDREFLQDIQDIIDRILLPRDAGCGTFGADFLQTFHYLTRCRSYLVGRAERVSPKLQGRHSTILEKSTSVWRIVDSHKAHLQTTLIREHLERLLVTAPAPEKPRSPKVDVMLNSLTAHPRLHCQCQKVTWASRYQECLDVPERFDRELCVLGCEGFTTGWHWWEVSVLEATMETRWAIGVARGSVQRKGSFNLSPQEGIWAVGKRGCKIVPFSMVSQKLSFQWPLQRLRVWLDYEAEKVEFLDAEREISLHTFQTGPFLGETLLPFFYLGQEGVTLSM